MDGVASLDPLGLITLRGIFIYLEVTRMPSHFEVAQTITDVEQLSNAFNGLLNVPGFKRTVQSIEQVILEANWGVYRTEEDAKPRYFLKAQSYSPYPGKQVIITTYWALGWDIRFIDDTLIHIYLPQDK